MNEFELIEKYFTPSLKQAIGVNLGVGDDCCLLQPAPGNQVAVSVDTLVAGQHFPEAASPEGIASRALRVCLSDLAAMGAEPRWFTLALSMPEVDEQWLRRFSYSLEQTANLYSCSLVGGDTTRGPLTISIQVMGELDKPLLRSGASPGDAIYVSGSLGDAAAALAFMQEELSFTQAEEDFFMRRYYEPEPGFAVMRKIKGLAASAIDVSDGLLADLGHICNKSRVGAELDLLNLPYSETLQGVSDENQREAWALNGGDDYELCFTVPPERVSAVDEMTLSGTLNATAIGHIVEGEGVRCYRHGQLVAVEEKGYKHFE